MYPAEVENRLAILGADLTKAVEDYKTLALQEAEYISRYDIEHAKTYYKNKIELEEEAKTKGYKITKDDIEAKTLSELEDIYIEMYLATAKLKAKDKHLKEIESKIDSYRSILSYMKEELIRTH